jgi:hypothetical protein
MSAAGPCGNILRILACACACRVGVCRQRTSDRSQGSRPTSADSPAGRHQSGNRVSSTQTFPGALVQRSLSHSRPGNTHGPTENQRTSKGNKMDSRTVCCGMGSAGRALGVLTAAMLLTLTAAARADVVPPPPTDCPDGTQPWSGHGGPLCVPHDCGGEAGPCQDDAGVCQSRSYCIEVVTMSRSGAGTYNAVRGLCPTSGSCDAGTCQPVQVCAQPIPSIPDGGASDGSTTGVGQPSAKSDSGCGCRFAARGSMRGAWVAMLVTGALLLRLGKRRSRRA